MLAKTRRWKPTPASVAADRPTPQARTTTPHRCSSTIGSSPLTCGSRVGDPVRGNKFDGVIGLPDTDLETVRVAEALLRARARRRPDRQRGNGGCGRRDVPGTADDSPDYDDGLPVVFTWPVLGSTVHPEDFLFTLTNGDQVVPNSAGLVPNWELNERNTVVVFGDFGNRGAPGEADAVYPAKLEIVDDGTPLRFSG